MILPLRWMLKRPGWLIPVFFLLSFQTCVSAQGIWPELSTAALGGAFVNSAGESCAGLNQAGLAMRDQNSLCLQHSRPYLLGELGRSSLSGQFLTGNGALGILLSTQGIKGLRQSSLWLSYGMKLHPEIGIGVGIHLWNSSLPEQVFYAPGMGVALGFQARVHKNWMVGAHVLHPASWCPLPLQQARPGMILSSGFSYNFLEFATVYSEIRAMPGLGMILAEGLEWRLNERASMSAGFSNKPTTLAWGISLRLSTWHLQFAFQYQSHSGTTPFTSLSHDW